MPRAELRLWPGIDDQRTVLLSAQNGEGVEWRKRGQVRQRRGAGAVDLGIARKVAGALRKGVRQQVNEVVAGRGFQGIVGRALFADGGETLGADLPPAQGTRAVGWIDGSFIAEVQQFVVQAVVEQARELLWRVAGREVGATHVADEQRVAGEHGEGLGRALEVR